MPSGLVTLAAIYAGTEAGRWAVRQDILPGFMGSVFGIVDEDNLLAEPPTGALLNKRSNVAPVPVIYGERTVGGTVVFLDVCHDWFNNILRYLELAVVLSEGEIDSVTNIYLDDVETTDYDFDPSEASYIVIQDNRTGTDDQQGVGGGYVYSDRWTSQHRLAGIAHLYCRFRWNPDLFPNGAPTVTATVKGIKVYDPRDTTTAWSDNPALCIRDYLTNTRYGCRIPESMIDDTAIEDAADYCDATSSEYDDGGTRKRYLCNGIVNTDQMPLDNLRQLLTSCRGMLIFTGGKYKLICDKAEDTPTFTFDADNIIGGWNIDLGDKRSRANRVRVRYFNSEKQWQPDIVVVDSETLRTDEDNGVVLEQQIELPYSATEGIARQLGTIHLNISRQSIRVSLTATLAALQNDVGDVVYIYHDTPAWTMGGVGKEFRIISMRIKNNDEVEVSLSEYADAMYTFDQILLYDPAPDTDLPDPWTCLPPGEPQLTESWYAAGGGVGARGKISVQWAPSETPYIEYYEVEYLPSMTFYYLPVGRFGPNETATEIVNLDPRAYFVRIRAANTLGVTSEWVSAGISITAVLGAPSDLTGLTAVNNMGNILLTWDPIGSATAPDLDTRIGGHIRIRYTDGSSALWGEGIETGIQVPGTGTQAIAPMAEDGFYMLKAVSSYGVESVNMASVSVSWWDPNVVELQAEKDIHDIDGDAPTDYWDTGDLTQVEENGANALRITQTVDPPVYCQYTSGDFEQTSDALQLAAAANCRVRIETSAYGSIINSLFDDRTTLIDTWESFDAVDNDSATAYAEVWFKHGATISALAGADWNRIITFADVYSRYFFFQIKLFTNNVDHNIHFETCTAKLYTFVGAEPAAVGGVY